MAIVHRIPMRKGAGRPRLPAGSAGAAVLVVVTLGSFVGPAVIGESVHTADLGVRNEPPWLFGGSSDHLFGTDNLGRDLLGRLLLAARFSLLVSLAAIALVLPIGTLSGMAAGYIGGYLDNVIMRLVDVVASFPGLLLAVVVVFVVGGDVLAVIAVLAVFRWPVYTRVARAEVLRMRELAFVDAARALGYGNGRMFFENFYPNLLPSILAVSAISLGQVILGEASLSFLGLGVQPPNTSLGLMVAQGRTYISSAWWLVTFPGLAIVVITLAIASIARAVSVRTDPHEFESPSHG